MGLFYTALERAAKEEGEVKAELESVAEITAPGAGPAPVTTWEEAERRDLAGFPLPEAERMAPPPAPPSPASPVVARRLVLRSSLDCETGDQAGIAKEQYRILRTRVLEAMHARNLRALLITSPGAGEGKTRVATDLALQFSSLKQGHVLLIDADLRRAGLTATLEPPPAGGLAHCLREGASLDSQLWEVDPWLSVLPTASLQDEAAEMLAGHRMEELLREARERFDLVLLDGAPVGPVVDSRILARLTGGALLVVRAGVSTTDAIEQAAGLLRPVLLGSVLNAATSMRSSQYGYPYAAKRADDGAAPEARP